MAYATLNESPPTRRGLPTVTWSTRLDLSGYVSDLGLLLPAAADAAAVAADLLVGAVKVDVGDARVAPDQVIRDIARALRAAASVELVGTGPVLIASQLREEIDRWSGR
jgi:hypothetical protein